MCAKLKHALSAIFCTICTEVGGSWFAKKDKNTPNLPDDTLKNLFDALNGITLTTTAVSLALISNVGIALNDTAFRARQEIKQLIQIEDHFGTYTPTRLLQKANPAYNLLPPLPVPIEVDPGHAILPKTLFLSLQLPSVIHPIWSTTAHENEHIPNDTTSLNQLQTVDNWRSFWNTLATYPLLRVQAEQLNGVLRDELHNLHDIGVFVNANRPNLPIGSAQSPDHANFVRTSSGAMMFEFLFPGFVRTAGWSEMFIELKIPSGPVKADADNLVLVVTPATIRESKSPFDLFFEECHSFLPKLERLANFDEEFPNLTKLGPAFRSLRLSDIDRILEEEAKRSKAELEVFGAKIPSELITIVGLPVLWLLLLQFTSICRYIRANTDAISPDGASKYPSVLRGFNVFTFLVLLLPVAASWLSLCCFPPQDVPFYLGAIVSTVLITASWCSQLRHLHKIKEMVRLEEKAETASTDIC